MTLEGKTLSKLNLGLRIGERMPTGYHRLRSIICPIDFGDSLSLFVGGADKEFGTETSQTQGACGVSIDVRAELTPSLHAHLIACGGEEAAARFLRDLHSPANLVFRAAEEFLAAAGENVPILFRLKKAVPPEAGLGGGSGDAAEALRLLSAAFPGRVDAEQLSTIALGLGSDVPALLEGAAVRVEGRGEVLKALELEERQVLRCVAEGAEILLLKPPFGSNTAAMYRALGERRSRSSDPPPSKDGNYTPFTDPALTLWPGDGNGEGLSDQASVVLTRSEMWKTLLLNDFEEVFFTLHPELSRYRECLLEAGAEHVFLAGSGSTLAALFPRFGAPAKLAALRKTIEKAAAEDGFFLRSTNLCPEAVRTVSG